jgi:hypothetical protein
MNEIVPLPNELTREELYTLVLSEPMLKVADRFGVSSSYMARICGLLWTGYPPSACFGKKYAVKVYHGDLLVGRFFRGCREV